jgi:RNA polymerase sigma factor (sigma-70 family)
MKRQEGGPVYVVDELRGIRGLKLDIVRYEGQIATLRSASLHVTARPQEGGKGTPETDTIGNYVAKIAEMNETLLKKIVDCQARIMEVEEEIDKLPANYRQVLRLRYFEGMAWKAIPKVMNYTRQHCERIHSYALEEIRNKTIKCGEMLQKKAL